MNGCLFIESLYVNFKSFKECRFCCQKGGAINGMFSYVYVFAFNGSTEGARYSIHFENLRISKSIGCGNFATNLPVVLDTTSLCESSN